MVLSIIAGCDPAGDITDAGSSVHDIADSTAAGDAPGTSDLGDASDSDGLSPSDPCEGAEGCDVPGEPMVCGTGGPCEAAVACDSATGACEVSLLANGAPCDDGDPCTGSDACKAGVCLGAPVVCSAPGPCQAAACDPTIGGCLVVSLPDGVSCDDGLDCTAPDTCTAGVCGGTCMSRWSCGVGCGCEQGFTAGPAVVSWGPTADAPWAVPPGFEHPKQIAVALDFAVVLRDDGAATLVGNAAAPLPSDATTGIVDVVAGLHYALLLRADGTVAGLPGFGYTGGAHAPPLDFPGWWRSQPAKPTPWPCAATARWSAGGLPP